jgi:hypothetical protein
MKRSKIVFLILAAIFFLAMMYVAYDISSRTSFPGTDKKNQDKTDTIKVEENSQSDRS